MCFAMIQLFVILNNAMVSLHQLHQACSERQRRPGAAAGRAWGVLGKQRSSCARGSSRSQPGAPTRCTVMRSGCGSSRWLHRSSSASTS